MPSPQKEKRGGLTLEKLTSYDDVITDALVDKVYYWAIIRKNRGGRFSASRGLHEEDIADIIRNRIILDKDLAEAVQQLLRLTGLRKFLAGLKDEKEREQFTRHLRRYASIYMPDCPFEVTTTNRYTITDHEASVTARRDINPREEIKYLTGVQVAMTEEQEKTLELARKDFSLVISSRKKTRSLFLGPARFANHDCDANAKLSTKGYDGMQIVAVKHIEAGEEITVSYGDDYFGDDNEECLCQTCENRQVNGWAPFRPKEEDDEEEENEENNLTPVSKRPDQEHEPFSSGKKRKYSPAIKDSSSDTESAYKKFKTDIVDKSSSPSVSPSTSPNKRPISRPLRQSTLKKAHSTSNLRKVVPISSIEDPSTNLSTSPQVSRDFRTQQRVGLLTVSIDEMSSSRGTTPQSSLATGSPQSTDATSVDEEPPMASKSESVDPVADTLSVKPTLGVATTVKTEKVSVKVPWVALFEDDSSSELSELSTSQDLDDVLQKIVKRRRSKTPPETRATRSSSRHVLQNGIGTPIPLDTIEEGLVENKRKPGDYMKSDALLSAKYSKWVECHTCDNFFVQQDGYLTRKDCPRCERHSKLYGYAWPKTDREGKHDKEQRILDHRTVHRFVDPEEEKQVKSKVVKKALKDSIVTRFSSPRFSTPSYREVSSSIEADSGRKRKRARKTM